MRITAVQALLLALCAAIPAGAAEPAPPVAAAKAEAVLEITGRVLDADGRPLAGAEVSLLRLPGPAERRRLSLAGTAHPEATAAAATGADGRFRLVAPSPGMWTVRVTARGVVPMEAPLLPLVEPVALPDARLAADTGLAVRVVDASGRPLPGARVRVAEPVLDGLIWRTAHRQARAADGAAVLPRADGEWLALQAIAPGHLPAELATQATGAVEIRLTAGCPRTVRVRGTGRRPEAGAFVSDGAWTLGTTDEAGRLEIAVPCESGLQVTAEAADGRRAMAALERRRAGRQAATAIDLPREPRRLAGRVLEEGTRAPVAGAFVWPADDPGAAVTTDTEGRYLVPAPEASGGRLSAASPSHLTGEAPGRHYQGEQAAGTLSGPTFSLRPTAILAGTVRDVEGRPVADAEVRLQPDTAGSSRQWPRTATDERGGFRLRARPGLPWRVTAVREGFAPGTVAVPPLAPRAARSGLEIVLTRGAVASGRVIDAEERPVAGAMLRLFPADRDDRAFFLAQAAGEEVPEATADAEGRFELRHLPPGRFDLIARAAGFVPRTLPGIEVPPGTAAVDLGTVALSPGAAIEGRVVDLRGQPIAGAAVMVSLDELSSLASPMPSLDELTGATTDTEGRFRIPDLAPGTVVGLKVMAPGRVDAEVPGIEAPTPSPVEIVLRPAARVAGRVVDERRQGIAEAQVVLTAEAQRAVFGGQALPGGALGQTMTDAAGAFVIEGVAPGTATLVATASGYRPARREGIEVAEGAEVAGIEVELSAGAVVTGRVSGADGLPLPDADVEVVRPPVEGLFDLLGSIGLRTQTDADGVYRLEGVPEGQLSIAAQHRDHLRAVRDLDVEAGENRLDLRLERGLEVEGRVLDAVGGPVAGAQLYLGGQQQMSLVRPVSSAEDGSFRFTGVAPGTYDLWARKEGQGGAEARLEGVRVAAANVTGLELRLEGGGAIRGRILGVEPAELAAVRIVAQRDDGQTATGRADHTGGYRVEPVGAGEWTVVAGIGLGRLVQGRVTLAPGQAEAELDLELEPAGGLTLSGRVLAGGEPATGVEVIATSMERAAGGTGTTGPDGSFRITGLAAGRYELMLLRFEPSLQHRETVELEGDRDVVIDLPAGRVSGQVVDAADGSPVAGAVVALEPATGPGSELPFAPGATSDAAGGFTLTGVGAGAFRLVARKEGYQPAATAVEMQPGAEVDGVRLALTASPGLDLTVVGPAGLPPAQVHAALLDDRGTALLAGTWPTREGGRLRIESVPAGRFWLLAVGDGGAAELEVGIPGPEVRVALAPTAELRVVAPALAGTPAVLAITGADGRPFRSLLWSQLQSRWESTDGRFTAPGLRPGVWTLTVTAMDGRTLRGTARAAGGGRVEVVLE